MRRDTGESISLRFLYLAIPITLTRDNDRCDWAWTGDVCHNRILVNQSLSMRRNFNKSHAREKLQFISFAITLWRLTKVYTSKVWSIQSSKSHFHWNVLSVHTRPLVSCLSFELWPTQQHQTCTRKVFVLFTINSSLSNSSSGNIVDVIVILCVCGAWMAINPIARNMKLIDSAMAVMGRATNNTRAFRHENWSLFTIGEMFIWPLLDTFLSSF